MTGLGRPRWPAILLGLALLVFVTEALKVSSTRLSPGYDEVSYLALGRQVARDGGVSGTVRCYFEGRCREDNRPPLYQMLLSPVMDDTPASFARAKLLELTTAALVIFLVFAVTRRRISPASAWAAAIALCLMPVMADYASRLMHDLVYVGLTFAAVHGIIAAQDRRARAWLGVGVILGLAFLTKGSGHLLWVPLLVTSLYRYRATLARRPAVYAAAAGFVVVSGFLLWRNWIVWRAPFHNVNAGEVWLDSWRDVFVMRLRPEHADLGLGWYLRQHSVVDLALKLTKGAAQIAGVFIYAAGIGGSNPILRVVTGALMVGLAAVGVRRRWKAGSRTEVVAVVSTLAVYFAALALGASGAPGPQVRYVLPYVVLLLPYAAVEIAEGIWPRIRERLAGSFPRANLVGMAALATLLGIRIVIAAPVALRDDPRNLYAVAPQWNETSRWLSTNLAPGERFAIPYMSRYSTWDLPRPDVDPRWPFWFGVPATDLLHYLEQQNIGKVLIDTADVDFTEYANKLSVEADTRGPLAFLGWPRCFSDAGSPSRFLVYCRARS